MHVMLLERCKTEEAFDLLEQALAGASDPAEERRQMLARLEAGV